MLNQVEGERPFVRAVYPKSFRESPRAFSVTLQFGKCKCVRRRQLRPLVVKDGYALISCPRGCDKIVKVSLGKKNTS